MRASVSALRTAVIVTALTGAVVGGSSIVAATASADNLPWQAAAPAEPSAAQSIYASDTGSAAIDLLTMLFNLPTGSLQKPCPPQFPDACTLRPPSGGSSS
ncbi:hypothetical protein OHB26_37785 [Nocardia sp. NBC_01503]|uniref:hypothetical protein n=1 Tax=Nocardia sp. NBC_01503 TaxID=2975997 RepID=UPI002E7ACD0B|nr:hypothetical protein [Nocardia sp. NBC_01503]WTL32537.1 hypothetical protein OHB26_37785 [Nocardia sp. NBC_01503]